MLGQIDQIKDFAIELLQQLKHSSVLYLTLTVLTASVLGSWHCAGMCGPIATLMNRRKGLITYHLGRLTSYVLSGTVIGHFGKLFLQTQITSVRMISNVTLFLFLLLASFNLLFDFKFLSLTKSAHPLSKWITRQSLQQTPYWVGFFSFALPCSWLWTFLALAATTQSAFLGGYTLFLFWLGGIPALNALPFVAKRMIGNTTLRQRKIAGVLLLMAAFYAFFSFFLNPIT